MHAWEIKEENGLYIVLLRERIQTRHPPPLPASYLVTQIQQTMYLIRSGRRWLPSANSCERARASAATYFSPIDAVANSSCMTQLSTGKSSTNTTKYPKQAIQCNTIMLNSTSIIIRDLDEPHHTRREKHRARRKTRTKRKRRGTRRIFMVSETTTTEVACVSPRK